MTTLLLIEERHDDFYLMLRLTGPGQPARTLQHGPYPDRKTALADYHWVDAGLDSGDWPPLDWQEVPAAPSVLEGHIERLYPPKHPKTRRWSVVKTPERTLWDLEEEGPGEEAIRALRRYRLKDWTDEDVQNHHAWLRYYLSLFEPEPTYSIRAIAPDGSVWLTSETFESRDEAAAELESVKRATREWERNDFRDAEWIFQSRVRDDQPFTFVQVRCLDGRLFNVAIWNLDTWGIRWHEQVDANGRRSGRYQGLELGQPVRWQVSFTPYQGKEQWTLTAIQ